MKTKILTINLSNSLVLIAITIILVSSCDKKNDEDDTPQQVPVLTTTAITNFGSSWAYTGGTISSAGAASVSQRGVCWSTSSNPVIAGNHTQDGLGTGNYSSSISGLTPSTTYYVRAYATNSFGTGYGNELSFTTQPQASQSFSAWIDGVQYSPALITINEVSGKIAISAMNGNKNMILWLPEDLTTGAHTFTLLGSYTAQYSDGITIWTATSGSINIEEYNSSSGKIKGSFNFVGDDFNTTIDVTDGEFEVYIPISIDKQLIGNWDWIKSYSWGLISTPETAGYTKMASFKENDTVDFYINDTLIYAKSYKLEYILNNELDPNSDSTLVIVFNESIVAYFSIENDTLITDQSYVDGSKIYYHRIQ